MHRNAPLTGRAVQVADFGLSRYIHSSQINTKTYGTITHMPPELLMEGRLSKSGDSYAFGCLLFSMFTGRLPWADFARMQVGCPSSGWGAPSCNLPCVMLPVSVSGRSGAGEITCMRACTAAGQPG